MISPSALEFLRSRPISMLCTRDRDKRPSLHECVLASIESDHVIGMVPEHLARNLKENVADNGDAALVVSRSPGDHRSLQLKGRITHVEDARERPEQFETPLARLMPVYLAFMPEEHARKRLDGMRQLRMMLFRFDVAQAFDQTPGPNAGRPITEGGS